MRPFQTVCCCPAPLRRMPGARPGWQTQGRSLSHILSDWPAEADEHRRQFGENEDCVEEFCECSIQCSPAPTKMKPPLPIGQSVGHLPLTNFHPTLTTSSNRPQTLRRHLLSGKGLCSTQIDNIYPPCILSPQGTTSIQSALPLLRS